MPSPANTRLGWVAVIPLESADVTGHYAFAGTTTGTRASRGTTSGAYTYAGAAASGLTRIGSGTGSYTFAGAAEGEARGTFVTLDPATGHLMLEGQRYRFAGNNWPGVALNEDTPGDPGYGTTNTTGQVAGRGSYALHLSSHSEIDSYLDQCSDMNATVIRSFAAMTIGHPLSVQPTLGTFSDANLEPLDYCLAECEERGIKHILPLVDNYQYFMGGKFDWCSWHGVTPDSEASQFFNAALHPNIRTSFKAHINFVLNHVNVYTGIAYKDDPGILAWESGNEIGIASQSMFYTWTEDIAAYVKAQGAQQLFMDGGCIGYVGQVTYDLSLLTHVDIHTQHPYGNAADTPVLTSNVGAHIKENFKKAWVNGEYPVLGYGFPTDIFGNHGANGWTLDAALENIKHPEVDGDLFWALFPQLEGHQAVFTMHSPGDNADMITRVNKLTAHAAAMPTLITSETLTDNMAGTNGTLLSAHTADSGSTYKVQPGAGDGTIQSNRVWFGAEAYVVSSATPPSRDYSVTGNIRIVSTVQNAQLYVLGRAIWADKTMYRVYLMQFSGSYSVTLQRWINGSSVDLATSAIVTADLTGTDHTLTMQMVGNRISVLWDGGTLIDGVADNANPYHPLMTTGHAGCGGLNGSSTTGIHLDSLTVTPYVPPTTLYPPVRRPNYGALVQF